MCTDIADKQLNFGSNIFHLSADWQFMAEITSLRVITQSNQNTQHHTHIATISRVSLSSSRFIFVKGCLFSIIFYWASPITFTTYSFWRKWCSLAPKLSPTNAFHSQTRPIWQRTNPSMKALLASISQTVIPHAIRYWKSNHIISYC